MKNKHNPIIFILVGMLGGMFTANLVVASNMATFIGAILGGIFFGLIPGVSIR